MTTVEDARTAPPVTGAEPEADAPRRRRRRLVWPALAVVLVAVGTGAWLWTSSASTDSSPLVTTVRTSCPAGNVSGSRSPGLTLRSGETATLPTDSVDMVARIGPVTSVSAVGAVDDAFVYRARGARRSWRRGEVRAGEDAAGCS